MNDTRERKRSHIEICTNRDVRFRKSTLLEEVELIHCALPECDLEDVSLATTFLDRPLGAPFFIGAMTGGTGDGGAFNMTLAEGAARYNIGMCLGSIRPALLDSSCIPEFQVKQVSKDLLVFANIGANQLNSFSPDQILDLSAELADGLMVHLNAGMELIQPGGDVRFSGQIDAIARLVERASGHPIIVKETGMGLSLRDGVRLKRAGVTAVETAGAGGTSWVGVETERATGINRAVGKVLWDFGIPTAASIHWMNELGFETIGSGGVYNALDAARAIRLGAQAVAMARPFLLAYEQERRHGVEQLIEELVVGLKYVMLCVGAVDMAQLKNVPCIVGNKLQRFFEIDS
ncbi:MAG: type 2 isopentenyl-diphosphate Delta-isomerase [Deltaproteobacteria bacterium]|nr:type 2 isopentenyl-diphosphate Delta-isomerase [Deltaproteobacteria bacterium]MBN2674039.1 type 2 isopentenyl-diphosphate Delta-isomerase [Deltaproteobacteria bacterium]